MPRTCKSGKLFAISETSIFQVFPLDSRREGLRERGWVIICWYFEKKATTYYVGRLYLLSFLFTRNIGGVLELPRGRLYPLCSGNNDISLCKGSKCRDDC